MKYSFTFLFILLFLSSCPRIKKPPLKIDPHEVPSVKTSLISLPIEVDVAGIEREIWRSLPNPLAEGTTGEVNVTVLATEEVTFKEWKDLIVEKGKKGYWETRYRSVKKTVSEAFDCFDPKKPWKIFKCYKEIVKLVKVPYDFWVPATKDIIEPVLHEFTKIVDKALGVSAQINYKIFPESFDLNVDGNSFTADTRIKLRIRLDYKQNAVPWGPEVRVKGALDCTIRPLIKIKGNIHLGDDADILVDIPDEGGEIEFERFCIPSAIKAFDIASKLNPVVWGVKKLAGDQLNKVLTKKIREAVAGKTGDLVFKDEILNAAAKINVPQSVAENIWIIPQLQEIRYTDIKGSDGKLKLALGFLAAPSVVYAAGLPQKANQGAPVVEIKKVASITPETQLMVDGRVNLDDAKEELNQELGEWVKEEIPDLPFFPKVGALYGSGEKFVIGLDIVRASNEKKKTSVYLWAVPKYDSDSLEVFLDEIEFTIQSKSAVLKYLGSVAEGLIVKFLEKESRWSIQEDKAQILADIKEFQYANENFIYNGKFSELDLSEVFVTSDELVVYITAKGMMALQYSPVEMGSEGARDDRKGRFADGEVIVENAIEDTHIESDLLAKLVILPGDTIFDESGRQKEAFIIAGVEDQTDPGDTLWFWNKQKEFTYHVLSLEEWSSLGLNSLDQ